VWHVCVGVWFWGCGGVWRYGRTKASEASPNPARHTYLAADSLAQSLVSHLGEGIFFFFSYFFPPIFYQPISFNLYPLLSLLPLMRAPCKAERTKVVSPVVSYPYPVRSKRVPESA
jgi:hypothetical protein